MNLCVVLVEFNEKGKIKKINVDKVKVKKMFNNYIELEKEVDFFFVKDHLIFIESTNSVTMMCDPFLIGKKSLPLFSYSICFYNDIETTKKQIRKTISACFDYDR